MQSKLIFPVLVILIGITSRLLPHAPNFTPIAAMALFAGAYMGKKQAFALPIIAMILSDVVIGFDSLPMRLTVYGSFLIMVPVGLWLKKHTNTGNIIGASLFGSVLFFVTTNFMVWAQGAMYIKNMTGLMEAYTFAIPFFRNSLLGDLVYTGAFFGGYQFINNGLIRHLIKRTKFAFTS